MLTGKSNNEIKDLCQQAKANRVTYQNHSALAKQKYDYRQNKTQSIS